jgi:hypothetical protein
MATLFLNLLTGEAEGEFDKLRVRSGNNMLIIPAKHPNSFLYALEAAIMYANICVCMLICFSSPVAPKQAPTTGI